MLFIWHNAQGQEHILVFFTPQKIHTSAIDAGNLYNQHVNYVDSLKKDQVILAHGRLENDGEILLFHKSDIDEVKNLLQRDPVLITGLYRPEYFHTTINYGEFCEPASTVPEEFNLVRYTTHITKYNVQQVPQLLRMHDEYLKKIYATGNVAAGGVFTNSDGGFLIIRGNLASEVIMNDPTFQAGFIIPEISDIFIPEGTFCK